MDEGLSIRHVQATDHQPVISVVDDWWGGRKMVDMLPKLFFVHFCDTSFVAEHGDQIVGFAIGFASQSIADQGYVHFLGVHPDFRKSGIARALYERCFNAFGRRGCRTVRCVTSPVNKGSIAFHLRMGFSVAPGSKRIDSIPVTENYDGRGEDRVLFVKTLPA